ncbi:MAG: L-histidine N(alpha)-methyltransferase [Nanoarchaeota archaeon]|nr:L-histidine N(alpha)-methyltransferase [Nanoarchaeota archaeon]
MIIKELLLKELVKNGYSVENGINIWDISDRSFRFINKEMADAYLKLKEHPRYKSNVIDKELKLLKETSKQLLKCVEDCEFNLIDMGCISGEKAIELIKSLPKNLKLRYCPVNVNEYLVRLAEEGVKKENFPNVMDYAPRISKNFQSLDEIGAALRNSKYQKNVFLLLGSLLSTFEINNYLFNLSRSMLPGDILIVGNGIRKGERYTNLETYKHPLFNEWLIHLMRELEFKDNEVEYNVRFAHNRLEAFYKIKINKTFEHEGKSIKIKKGDEIIVIFQNKFFANELRDFCDMYFDEVKLSHDIEEEYAIVFCKK